MAHQELRVDGVKLFPHAAVLDPTFALRTVISPDPFAYVRLKLERREQRDALVYWRQAEEFFRASSTLSSGASPVTSYYCMLNAVKALLSAREVPNGDLHGLSGSAKKGKVSLAGEYVRSHKKGVFPALIGIYDPGLNLHPDEKFTLQNLLSEMPFVHRAYTLTYSSKTELFLPLEKPVFVRREASSEAWFCAHLPASYAKTKLRLSNQFEQDSGIKDAFVIRAKEGFLWDKKDVPASLNRLANNHRTIREEVLPIVCTGKNRWYLRKPASRGPAHSLPFLGRIFAVMHRLSELSRYDPVRLDRHLKSQHHWLLTEFLSLAPAQFVHIVASELAGTEFLHSDSVRLPNA